MKNINLSVRAGEIVGIAGLVGAGRTEFARVVFGLDEADTGEILLNGKPIHNAHPRDAIRHKIAYLPEDRRKHGVILDLPISSNITLASLKILSSFGGMDFKRERELAAEYTTAFGRQNAFNSRFGGDAFRRKSAKSRAQSLADYETRSFDFGRTDAGN